MASGEGHRGQQRAFAAHCQLQPLLHRRHLPTQAFGFADLRTILVHQAIELAEAKTAGVGSHDATIEGFRLPQPLAHNLPFIEHGQQSLVKLPHQAMGQVGIPDPTAGAKHQQQDQGIPEAQLESDGS